ncbi:MAG TPA: hypothetical protein VGW12_15685 [Pyrinomonadaceae bacterium]|nr:hypothetical protein [Pyrinomonadaceae bacterium]
MSDPVSGVMSQVVSEHLGGATHQAQQQKEGGRSFESVLQQNGGQSGGGDVQNPAGQPAQISGAELERLRVDLQQRIESMPVGASNKSVVLPEWLDTRTRLGLLREALGSVGNTPKGTDLRGQFGRVEAEWKQLESIMMSDNQLSQGELLGLQARLYQVSQHVEVMSKVVDQVTGGVKTILNTNV